MAGSTKGLVVYNSAGYNTLCFAKMMKSYRRSFSVIQLKECLQGVFHETGISRAKEQLKSLEKNGYVSQVSEGEWVITENGIEQIFKSAAVYRGQKERFLGKRYVANTNKQISNIAKSDSIDKYDEEEEILIDVENRMRLIKNRRASQKSKYRSR